MRLSKEARADYAQLIKNACGHLPSVFENGVFEFFGLDEAAKNRVLNDLKAALFVDDIYARADKQYADKYHLTGMLVEKLDEDIEIHDGLNPKLWTADNELKDDVHDKIIEIVDAFVEQLKDDNIDLVVDDIYLIGSNANYNYNDQSDLDIHIIADESADCTSEHLPIIYNAYKRLFNKNYDITLNGINAEVYVENKDDISNVSSGVYSIAKGWIKKPATFDIPKIDNAELEKLVQKYESKYLDIVEDPSIELIDALIDELYVIRGESISAEGEFGLANVAPTIAKMFDLEIPTVWEKPLIK
jgi:hypothetical protein